MRISRGLAGAAVCVSLLGRPGGVPARGASPLASGWPLQPTRALQPDRLSRLDRLTADLHRRGLFDGALVVGRGPDVLWERGYGNADVERQIPFGADTPTDAASLAKTFTATLVLELEAEGRLHLDAPIARWLPELPYPDITWRHLLSHSSGLPVLDYDYFDAALPANRVRTTEMLLGVLATRRPSLAFAPGTAFEYSSFGFDLAALAAARVTRGTYAQLLAERIFQPFGLTAAFVRPGRLRDFRGVRTRGYRRVGPTLAPNDVFDFEGFHGGSNVYASARDLHRWNASFLDARVASAPARRAALRPARIGNAASGLTLGSWYRSSDASSFWYSGHLQGFHSEVFRDMRTRLSIVYVSNNTLELWLQKALVRAVRAIVAGADVPPLVAPDLRPLTSDTSGPLTGPWLLSDGSRLVVERRKDHLALRWNGVRYRLVPIGGRAVYAPGADMIIGLGAGPTPSRLYVSTNVDERWAARTRAD